MKKLFFTLVWLGCLLGLGPLAAYGQAVQTVIFEDLFEEGTLQSEWSLHPNLSGTNGMIELQNGTGIAQSYCIAIGKNASSGGFTTNGLDLALDLSAFSQVALDFYIKDIGDITHQADGLYFSDDGGQNFVKVLDFDPSSWCNDFNHFPPIDVDALARQHGLSHQVSNFVIRWQQRGERDFGSFYGGDGFYLDQVKVFVPALSYASLPLEEDFEEGILNEYWTWRFADSTATQTSGEPLTRPSNEVRVRQGIAYEGDYALHLAKTCADGWATHAVDLHLNLQGLKDVFLSFQIYDYGDETQDDDAIYFSDNGGRDFTKVYQLDPSNWCNQWGQLPPLHMDRLAAKHGLVLSDSFVVRFQNRGEETFGGFYGGDGFYLDNILVEERPIKYAPLPYSTGFENRVIDEHWLWRPADETSVLSNNEPATRTSNLVGITEYHAHTNNASNAAVYLGQSCGEEYVATALDLHLRLANQTNVVMTCYLMDIGDDSEADDALLFSADGGYSWKKVHEFDWGSTANQYNLYTFDISQLAADVGLPLTDSFVVRFQHYGRDDVVWGSGHRIFLDDISVEGSFTTHVHNQFEPTLRLFPNPTEGRFTFELGHPSPIEQLRLLDTQGRQMPLPHVPTGQQGRVELDISHLPAGLYHLEIQTKEQRLTTTVQRR